MGNRDIRGVLSAALTVAFCLDAGAASAGQAPQAAPPVQDPGTTVTAENVGRLQAQAQALSDQERYAEALPIITRVVEFRDRTQGRTARETLEAALLLANTYADLSQIAQAEHVFGVIIPQLQTSFGADDRLTLTARAGQASMYVLTMNNARAVALLAALLPDQERVFGPDHARTLNTMSLLASLYGESESTAAQTEALLTRLVDGNERRRGPNHEETLDAVGQLARFLAQHQRSREADALFLRVLRGREASLGADHARTLETVRQLAVRYQNESRYAEAEPLFQRVLAARERLLGADHADTQAALIALVALYRVQGRDTDAAELLQRYRTVGARAAAANPDSLQRNLAQARIAEGESRNDEAERLYRLALDQSRQANGPDHPQTVEILADLGDLLIRIDRMPEGAPLYREAIAILDRVQGPESQPSARMVDRFSFALSFKGHFVEQEPLLLRLIAHYERLNESWRSDLIFLRSSLADNYRERRLYARAEPNFRLSLEQSAQRFGRSNVRTLDLAEDFVRSELSRTDATPQVAADAAALMVEGSRARRANIVGGAAAEQQNAREAIDAGRRFALFADATYAATDRGRRASPAGREAVFTALQDATIGPANGAIARMAARREAERDGAIAALVRQRETLTARQASLTETYSRSFAAEDSGPATRAAIERELPQVQQELATLDAALARDFPAYFALTSPTPLTIEAAQALLGPDEAILLTVPSAFGTHVVAVTRDGVDWRRSGWNEERVRRAVQRLRWDAGALVQGSDAEIAALQAGETGGAMRFDRGTAHQLYREIVQPVAQALAGRRRVYIVAGGPLAALPFSLLVSAPPSGADDNPAALRATRWFGSDVALVHLPSIQSLALLRRSGARPAGQGFIGIGNPVLGPTTMARDRQRTRGLMTGRRLSPRGATRSGDLVIDLGALRAMPSLPGTGLELEAVRRTLGAPPSALITQAAATEQAVRSADLSNAGILLFSTHGLTAAEATGIGEAGLVLTPPAGATATNADDGYLSASDVATLSLNADWVILSACNTATGDMVEDVGLGPLARSFFFAGARNLLASHWPVSDDVAPVLITRILALERSGVGRAEAFRMSMREIRDDAAHPEWAHPFYWAPFVLIGEGAH